MKENEDEMNVSELIYFCMPGLAVNNCPSRLSLAPF